MKRLDREDFANDVCKLLMATSNYDIEKALNKVEDFYNYFEEWVRNVYEVWEEVPLVHLWYLLKHDASNFGITQDEYEKQIQLYRNKCIEYYI